jgi:hypothetical protein
MKGYGLFWVIVEMLHEDSCKWMDLDEVTYIAIKNASGCDVKYIRSFIEKSISVYKIFIQEGNRFTTDRVLRNIGKREEIKEKRSNAGKESAKKRGAKQPENEHMFNTCSTHAEQNSTSVEQNPTKESKVKESKVKQRDQGDRADLSESNLYRKPKVPTLDEVREAFDRSGGSTEMADKFFLKHNSTGWFLNGSPIVSFASLVPSYIHNWNQNRTQKPKITV